MLYIMCLLHKRTFLWTDTQVPVYVHAQVRMCPCALTHTYTHIQIHTHGTDTDTHTHNTYLHLRTRGCYSTDGIRANGLYHVVELLSLNSCHLSGLCDLKFILFPNIFSLSFSGSCQPLQF